MGAAKKLEHFSHQHALTLAVETSDKLKVDEENRQFNLRCFGCTEKITEGVAYYRCEEEEEGGGGDGDCRFYFLHQACADMPMTTVIGDHEDVDCDGDLKLKKYLQPDQSNHTCRSCEMRCNRFAYACSECAFLVCFTCAMRYQGKVKMSFHQHPVHRIEASGLLCSVCSLSTPTYTDEWDTCFGCDYWY